MKGIIIGAGIGGLSAAISMRQRGIDFDIFEAVPNLTPVGAGILVPPNAMTILGRYGLSEQVQAHGSRIKSLVVMDTQARVISKTSSEYSKNNITYPTVAIHRGKLQQILLAALPDKHVTTGKRCIEACIHAQGVAARFSDNSRVEGDFLIGADGIHSVIRESIFPNSPLRYSGQTCWRGIANLELSRQWATQLTEVWGAGLRFGFVPISSGQVYWYATKRESSGGTEDREKITQQLISIYRSFPDPIAEILSRTDMPSIIRDDIYDLAPLRSWFSGRAILVGDAAHASTPNLGQGGAQAIEDSWVLADKIASCKSLPEAFQNFQASRLPKVEKIVSVSWQIGRVTNLSNKLACVARNTLFRCVPSFVAKQQARLIYDVSY